MGLDAYSQATEFNLNTGTLPALVERRVCAAKKLIFYRHNTDLTEPDLA